MQRSKALRYMADQSLKLKLDLTRTIYKDVLSVPNSNPNAKEALERLLEEDRQSYHCFWGPVPFHNHLSHQYVLSSLSPKSQLIRR